MARALVLSACLRPPGRALRFEAGDQVGINGYETRVKCADATSNGSESDASYLGDRSMKTQEDLVTKMSVCRESQFSGLSLLSTGRPFKPFRNYLHHELGSLALNAHGQSRSARVLVLMALAMFLIISTTPGEAKSFNSSSAAGGQQKKSTRNYYSANPHLTELKIAKERASEGSQEEHPINDTVVSRLSELGILIDRDKLILGDVLGSGHYGIVYSAFLRSEKTDEGFDVVVKTLRTASTDPHYVDESLAEGLIMQPFKHENVLNLVGIAISEDNLPLVVTPLMSGGELKSYLEEHGSTTSFERLLGFGLQIARGMAYLSSLGIVHRDLAARNCLLDEKITVKIADFGLARKFNEQGFYAGHESIAHRWSAIESLEHDIFTSKSDVWSYGIVLWEILNEGVDPYPTLVDRREATLAFLHTGKRMEARLCPDNVYNIILRCWREDPDERPTFDELVTSVSEMIDQLRLESERVAA